MRNEKELSSVTLWGAAANIALSAVKLTAGVLGRSSAMTADAIHSLSDLVSDVVVYISVKMASKGKDKDHDYGHGRYETLATAAVAILLLLVGARLMEDGVGKIKTVLSGGVLEIPGKIALWAALASIIVKEILYQWTAAVGRRNSSPAVITNAWHHRTDALSSVASALGIGSALIFGGKWAIMDPVVCCGISIFIFYIAAKMGIPAINDLTDASLPEDQEEEIIKTIMAVEGILNVHSLKTRNIGPNISIACHAVVDPHMSVAEAHDLMDKAEEALREEFGQGTHISLHVEPYMTEQHEK